MSESGVRGVLRGVPLVVVTRGGRIESVHRGSVAVVTEKGRLLASAGDPRRAVWLRSSAKPFQLTPFLAAGGEARFALTTDEIALAAASHSGERAHVRTAEAMLGKGGFTVEDLHCGAHPPMHADSARALASARQEPTPLHNNCSGKHAAMLLACRLLGFDAATYWRRRHPLQRRILKTVSRMAGVPAARIALAVDGCSVPVFRVPLHALALGYARLVGEGAPGETPAEAAARRRIAAAMASCPEMVAGTGRFTTDVMRAFRGALVAKEGAEGVYAVGVSAALARRRDRQAVGIAIKIDDGAERGRDAVTVEVLRQLGFVSGSRHARLRKLAEKPVRNVRGDVVGDLRTVFRLAHSGEAG
jgi:L-asparaginase II